MPDPKPLSAEASLISSASLLLLTAVAAFVVDWGSLAMSRSPGQVASIWPGDAVVLVLLLANNGRGAALRFAAGFVGAVLAELVWGDGLLVGVGLTAANFLSIAIVFAALRLRGRIDLQRTAHVLRFLAVAGVASMAGAVCGAGLLNVVWRAPFFSVWPTWALGDWLGYAAIAPPLLVLTTPRRADALSRVSLRQAVMVLAAYTVLTASLFAQTRYPLLFLAPLALFAVAYLIEIEGVMTAILITVVVGTAFTMIGRGPGAIIRVSPAARLVLLQFFLVSMTIAFLPISAIMTERRRLEAALREARAAAEAASALKSEFLANVSHELRTPLASVLGFAGILRNNAHLEAEDREHADSIAVAGSALLTTVNDILAFSELEAGRLDIQAAPASPRRVAEEAIKLFHAGATAKGLRLSLKADPGLPAVLIDGGRVRQLLLNLLANAVKFTDAGSIEVIVDHDAGILRLAVADTGPGLEPDRIPLLFDRFSRADAVKRRRHGGTGLGLSICKGLVDAMGGSIGVDSVIGRGTTVTLVIPAPIASIAGTTVQ